MDCEAWHLMLPEIQTPLSRAGLTPRMSLRRNLAGLGSGSSAIQNR